MKTNLPFVFKRVFCILSEMELWSSSKRVVFVFFWHPPLSDLLSYSCCLPASRVLQFYSSVQLSCSVVSDCLRPHELQHTRLPCPSPSHRARSNSCPLSWWCHPTISPSVVPYYLQSFPASGSFSVNQFTAGGQRIWASASASVLPMNIQGWFPYGLNGLISLQCKRLSRVFNTTVTLLKC